jgi:hypothetical protein
MRISNANFNTYFIQYTPTVRCRVDAERMELNSGILVKMDEITNPRRTREAAILKYSYPSRPMSIAPGTRE